MCVTPLISTEILVGFETVFISADEGNDTVELCVSIFTDAALLPTHLNMSFSLDLISVPGTGGNNYYIDFSNILLLYVHKHRF